MLANVFLKTTRDRWKGMAIAFVTLAGFLLLAMSMYRNLDLSIYTDLPEAVRTMMGIPAEADVGSLAIGVIFASYGALTLAALALSMGSASIAGEESNGTIDLLLANPKSRTHVLVSKAASMVLLVGVAVLGLWGAIHLVSMVLNVKITGMNVGALSFHLFLSTLFYGFLAMAIGAWTGNKGLASGATIGVMVLSFFAVGLLPLIEGLENLTKAFPWYYYDGSDPLLNGIDWGHIGILFTGIALFLAAAVIGVNRRDLKGESVGVTLLDRLRANPMTQKIVNRLAGSARVSRIWIKTFSEYQGFLIITAYVMFLVMGVAVGPIYNWMPESMMHIADQFPEALLATFGGGNMSTPEGWYQIETFGMMAPIAVMIVTIAVGARGLAGEEAHRTMGLLLANPIKRSKVVIEKTVAMTLCAITVGFMTFAGVALGSALGGLGINIGNIAATCLLVTLLGLAFGALALALSAATGRGKIAVFLPIGAGIAFHLLNSFAPLNAATAALAKWSPFYYYLGSDPLINGMNWLHGAILAGITIVLVALSVMLFQRRDLRQTG